MRPTDEEIDKQAFKWDHSIQDKEDFELGAKWARDFDPWYYIEDLTNEFIRQNFVDKHFLVKTFNNEYCTGVLANNSHGGIGKFLVAFANEKELFFDDIYAFLPLNEIKPKR